MSYTSGRLFAGETTGITVTAVPVKDAAEGVASDSFVSGAIVGSPGTSAGLATVLGTTTNTESRDGTAAGVGAASGIGLWFAPVTGASSGISTPAWLAASILAGKGDTTVAAATAVTRSYSLRGMGIS